MNKEKQEEFDAFSAYYAVVSKRPSTASAKSLINQLDTIARGQYGNGPFQELRRANRRENTQQQTQELTLGKQGGGGLLRRNQPPQESKTASDARRERIEARLLAQGGKLGVSEVVAGGNGNLQKTPEILGADAGNPVDPDQIIKDALNLQAKDVVEKYGRDLLFEMLVDMGEPSESLEQKTDRQLANLLKKKSSE